MKKQIKIVILLFIIFTIILITKSYSANSEYKAYLDAPIETSDITNKLNISGWVMSGNNISINVYINDNYICNIERNQKREDVLNAIKGYGGKEKNPVPGFNYTLDISEYNVGIYNLKLEIFNKEKLQTIGQLTRKFTINNIKSKSYIDNPKNNIEVTINKIDVSGWVMSEGDIQIKAYIDNNYVQSIQRNMIRQDVINAIKGYGTEKENPMPGYQTSIDIGNIDVGAHTLKIEIIDNNRNSVLESKKVNFKKTEAKMYIDNPANNKEFKIDKLQVSGWILSDSNIKIKAYINDNFVKEIQRDKEREDVLNAIKGYGGKEKNPMPGFQDYIDLSNYIGGKYTLKLEIINEDDLRVIEQQSKNFLIGLPNTKIYIDTPINNYNSLSNRIDIDGWAMSEGNINLKIYVDDIYIKDIQRNKKREDVLNAIKGCGTIKENPLQGFSTILDVTGFYDGKHTLKIEAVKENTNEVIISKTINFNKELTKAYLDKPSTNEMAKEKLQVSGWVMSDKNIEIKAFIDSDYIGTIDRTLEREDVINAIKGCGGKEKNPMPGFDTMLDVSNYKSGTHTLRLEIINSDISHVERQITRTFYKTLPESKGYIDGYVSNQTVIGDNLTIQGWVMSETDIKLELHIDNEYVQDLERNVQREDVLQTIKGYGGNIQNPTPGYMTNLDVSNYKDGLHTISIKVISTKTDEVIKTISQKLNIKKYEAKISIESPQISVLNKEVLEISGWGLSKAPNKELQVYFDGNKLELTKVEREDIFTQANIKKYGNTNVNINPGFETVVNLSEYSDGNHKIKVQLINTDMNEILVSEEKNIIKYSNIKMGIDVSSYQENIDWQAVRRSGIEFAMIRAGFRGYGISSDGTDGKLVTDSYFYRNIEGAINNGIGVGVYFFTQAKTEQEAIDEANYTLNLIKNYRITYPIVIDTEWSSNPDRQGRADGLSVEERTRVVKAFCETIKKAGYQPMIYANKWWFSDNLDMSQLQGYKIWLAHYTGATQNDPLAKPSNYKGEYTIWQYTSTGNIDGITGNVDMNIEYISNK